MVEHLRFLVDTCCLAWWGAASNWLLKTFSLEVSVGPFLHLCYLFKAKRKDGYSFLPRYLISQHLLVLSCLSVSYWILVMFCKKWVLRSCLSLTKINQWVSSTTTQLFNHKHNRCMHVESLFILSCLWIIDQLLRTWSDLAHVIQKDRHKQSKIRWN